MWAPDRTSAALSKHFQNSEGRRARGLLDVLRWKLTSGAEPSPAFFDDVLPSVPPARVEGAELRVTFINHSTVLIQHAGFNILTDPRGTARLIAQDAYAELDWGQSSAVNGCRIHRVPAVHFSGRGLFDRNKTLWCGYVIESPHGNIYFAADTGFGHHLVSVRDNFGPLRLAFLPIGAFLPRWFMEPIHMSPEDALHAHEVLGVIGVGLIIARFLLRSVQYWLMLVDLNPA